MIKKSILITGVLVLVAALAAGVYAVLYNKPIIPNQAAVVGGSASLSLEPTGGNLPIGSASSIALKANMAGKNVDGFQVVATISGNLPSNLQFVATPPQGMQTISNSITGTTTKTLKLAFITTDTGTPYTNTTPVAFGQLNFTPTAAGQMTIAFDNILTKIVQNQTSQDILNIPASQTYVFTANAATPTPTPTAAPTTDSCIRRTQIISLTPTSQSGHRGNSLAYTITVKNDDSSECGASTFSFSAILPYSNWSATFSSFSRNINPGDTSTATVNFISSANSPFGTLPVGVNVSGPKAATVAAANYVILQPTATPKPTTKATTKPGATPEVITVPGSLASTKPSATPVSTPTVEPIAEEEKPAGILSSLPNAVIYGIGGFLLIILFFILRALFKGGDKNPPKLTPATPNLGGPVSQVPTSQPTQPAQPMTPPVISHSVEPPITNSPVV